MMAELTADDPRALFSPLTWGDQSAKIIAALYMCSSSKVGQSRARASLLLERDYLGVQPTRVWCKSLHTLVNDDALSERAH